MSAWPKVKASPRSRSLMRTSIVIGYTRNQLAKDAGWLTICAAFLAKVTFLAVSKAAQPIGGREKPIVVEKLKA